MKEYITFDKGHGRVETRHIKTLPVAQPIQGWPTVMQICKVTRTRWVQVEDTESCTDFYYITSLTDKKANAKKLLSLIRNHWAIENNLHWNKDVTFNEDRATQRTGNSPQNLATIRNTALTILKKLNLKPKAGREYLSLNINNSINAILYKIY